MTSAVFLPVIFDEGPLAVAVLCWHEPHEVTSRDWA